MRFLMEKLRCIVLLHAFLRSGSMDNVNMIDNVLVVHNSALVQRPDVAVLGSIPILCLGFVGRFVILYGSEQGTSLSSAVSELL